MLNGSDIVNWDVLSEVAKQQVKNNKIVFNKKINYYDNVASMKADNTLKVGDMVVTLGYYDKNDAGGATYFITDSIKNTDQLLWQEKLENNLFADLYTGDKYSINMKQIGLKGDGVTDNLELYNKIYNKANWKKCEFYFPRGTYYFSDSINVPQYCNFHGDSVNEYGTEMIRATFLFDGANLENKYGITVSYQTYVHDICIKINGAYEITEDRKNLETPYVENVIVKGVGGLKVEHSNNKISSVKVSGASDIGIYVYTYNIVKDICVTNSKIGLKVCNDSLFTDLLFIKCYMLIYVGGAMNIFDKVRADSAYQGIYAVGSMNRYNNLMLDWVFKYGILIIGNRNTVDINGRIAICSYDKNYEDKNVHGNLVNFPVIINKDSVDNIVNITVPNLYNYNDSGTAQSFGNGVFVQNPNNSINISTDISPDTTSTFRRLVCSDQNIDIPVTINNVNYLLKNWMYCSKVLKQNYEEYVPVTGLTFNNDTETVVVGDTVTPAYTITPDNVSNKEVTFTSSDTSIADVNEKGVVTGIAQGTATITISTKGGKFADTCTVIVSAS